MSASHKTLADLTRARLTELAPTTSIRELAERAGFQTEETLLQIAAGQIRLPIERFGSYSDALGAERAQVLYLALKQFFSAEMVDEMVQLLASWAGSRQGEAE